MQVRWLAIGSIPISLCALVWLTTSPARGEAVMTGSLPRAAEAGFVVEAAAGELRITRLDVDAPAAKAGLEVGDVLRAVDGSEFDVPHVGQDLLRRLDAGRPTTLTVDRAGEQVRVTFVPRPRPLEDLEGVDSINGVVEIPDGTRLRSILTRPEGSAGPLPAIFFTQWVSCDSVELDLPGAWREVMRGVAERSGAVMIRVERAASGDSEGPGCHELDFETEVAHYRHAFETLTRSEHVDRERVVIWGNSLGGLTRRWSPAARVLSA